MKKWKAALAASLLAALVPALHAEIWGYVDDHGVAHFSSEKVDERYGLFYRGGEGFDTSAGVAAPPRALAVPAAGHKLAAFFEISPSFRQVKHHLREASRSHGIDYELLKALIATESGFDPRAVSPKGAVGLMQLMPATAERYGLTGDRRTPLEKKLTDPRTNIKTGTRYLRYLIDLFPGRLDLALAAYNAGEGAVQRAGNKVPNYRETQNYVKTVMQLYSVLKPPSMGPGPLKGRVTGRIRMELPVHPQAGGHAATRIMGGAANRGNLPSGPSQLSRPSQPSTASTYGPASSLATASQSESRFERD